MKMMTDQEPRPHADQKYIQALLDNDHSVLTEIYKKFSNKVVAYIRKNNGDAEDGRDVIQETLITIYQQASAKKLVLTCPFEAYFFLLCKRKWLNKLKVKKGVTIDEAAAFIPDESTEMVSETELFESKSLLFESKLKELGEKCQEVLRWSFKLPSMEEVAAKLNVTYGYIRKKKSLCLGQLTDLIRQSAEYKKLKDQ
jgi:RNA polymerase sigma factor (sigma-70 family)